MVNKDEYISRQLEIRAAELQPFVVPVRHLSEVVSERLGEKREEIQERAYARTAEKAIHLADLKDPNRLFRIQQSRRVDALGQEKEAPGVIITLVRTKSSEEKGDWKSIGPIPANPKDISASSPAIFVLATVSGITTPEELQDIAEAVATGSEISRTDFMKAFDKAKNIPARRSPFSSF